MKMLLVILGCMVLAACSMQRTEVRTPTVDEQIEHVQPNYANGSLWQASSTGLTEDGKARRKGDILTIIISEQASASKEATTGTARKTSVSAGVPNLMGLETSVTGIKNWMDLSNLINASSASKFDGSGSTTRKENLSATITVKVMEVMANGNLLVSGRRSVKVNSEDQLIMVEGTVRSRDVSPDNTINSALVADARITYTGKGIVSDQTSPGWLTNIFNKIWPF